MRAADAIVSKAPKPMKIFPISEVLSRVELSLLKARVAASAAGLTDAIATVWVELEGGSCRDRSLSLSWSAAVAAVSAGACASAGLSAAACRFVLAFADMASDIDFALSLALSDAASVDIICAFALASHSGIAAAVLPLASATSLSEAFLVSTDFEATCLYVR